MIQIKNNFKGNYGNTCQNCNKIMGQNELKTSTNIYVKIEGKRGQNNPVCCKQCEIEFLNKIKDVE